MTYDKDIREPLFDFLEEKYGHFRILEELNIGKSRADVVMVANTALCGIEIKSDADSYARLAGQIRDYDRYFDRNLVVVGTKHAMHIEEHVPAHWGIITVEPVAGDGSLDFYMLREPKQNPSMLWKKKLSLLWKPELAVIQEHFSMPKYKNKSVDFITDKVSEKISGNRSGLLPGKLPQDDPAGNKKKAIEIPEDELQRLVCSILMERDYTTIAVQLREFRKSETQKKLEAEPDPFKKLAILMNKPVVGRKRTRRRRSRFL